MRIDKVAWWSGYFLNWILIFKKIYNTTSLPRRSTSSFIFITTFFVLVLQSSVDYPSSVKLLIRVLCHLFHLGLDSLPSSWISSTCFCHVFFFNWQAVSRSYLMLFSPLTDISEFPQHYLYHRFHFKPLVLLHLLAFSPLLHLQAHSRYSWV